MELLFQVPTSPSFWFSLLVGVGVEGREGGPGRWEMQEVGAATAEVPDHRQGMEAWQGRKWLFRGAVEGGGSFVKGWLLWPQVTGKGQAVSVFQLGEWHGRSRFQQFHQEAGVEKEQIPPERKLPPRAWGFESHLCHFHYDLGWVVSTSLSLHSWDSWED